MKKYRNKYNEISNQDSEEEKFYPSGEYPSYKISKEYQQNKFPSGYENSHHISKQVQYNDPYGKKSKISSKSEKYYSFYTESSPQKVNFENKNSAKNYMDKRAYTPSHLSKSNSHYSNYISELREEYSNPMTNNRVNIRKKVYRGNQTPQPYASNEQKGNNNEEEEFLDNYGYHETKNIKNKGHTKYDSITHITGYSNLIPLNRLKQCGRIETYNYSSKKEQDNQPKLRNAIEKVRELQRGKREYDEFMRKLGANESNEEKIENYKREQLRQQEIREEKIRMERIKQEKMREEQIRNEKIRQEKLRIERMRKEEELRKEKAKKEQKKQEELRQIKIREEKIRQEKIRQEKIRQDKLKQQEKLRQEKIKQEKLNQGVKSYKEKIKDNSKQKIESYKRIVINTEGSSKSRGDSIKKQFKAHSGRYTYKENINEDINHYRTNSNYNKEQKNVGRKETIYKNKKNNETNKSYSQLPIKMNINTTTSYSRNHSSKNLKTITDHSIKNKDNKNQSYLLKSTKTTITSNINKEGGRKNTFKSNNISINNDKNKNKNMNKYVSNYTKQSHASYTNINNKRNNYPNKTSNNYKRSMLKVEEKTVNLNYPNRHIKSNYVGEPYHQDYINIENSVHGKIMNHIHTGVSKDGQYLISMTSAQKISDENDIYELPEKNIEEIVSTVRERKKNLGDNYAFYESKHLLKPDNSSYTIHKRFGERTIFGKEKYETKKVRHYKIKPGEERKYYDINDNDINNYNIENNMIEYKDCGYGCMNRDNENIDIRDDYENVNFDYSPEGEEMQEGQYENNVEEYNYENYESY